MSTIKKHWQRFETLITTVFIIPTVAMAQPKPSSMSNPLAQTLVVIILALLLVIGLLAHVVIGAAQLYLQRLQEEKQKSNTIAEVGKIVMIIVLCGIGSSLMAQDANAATAVASSDIAGLSSTTFFALMSVITLEIVILFALLYNLRLLLRREKIGLQSTVSEEVKENAWAKWWEKANSFKPIKEEVDLDLGHDYDGIRELDNNLPPWWLYGFYLCVFFAIVYLYRFHVSGDAPLSKEEYQMAMAKADVEKEEYLKKAANLVDENTVTLSKDPADIEAGKKIFTTVCAACHVADGGGAVGPNLTDDYWLHGGSIKDVFKTIKYGWQEKGMKSWKDDYSPVQIAQLASYVKSLHGTKPAKPKDPQGTLYQESASPVAAGDSVKAATNNNSTALK